MERYNHLLELKKHESAHVMYSLVTGFVSAVLAIACLSVAFNILNTRCTIADYGTIEGYSWKEPMGPHGGLVYRSMYSLPTNITYYRYGKSWKGILLFTSSDKDKLENYKNIIPIKTTLDCSLIEGNPHFNPYQQSIIYHVLGWISVVTFIMSICIAISWTQTCTRTLKQLNMYGMVYGNGGLYQSDQSESELPGNYA